MPQQLIVDWCWVPSLCGHIVLRVFPCCSVVECTGQDVNSGSLLIERETHSTRFCVHCRSFCTSFAAFMPSAKFARAPANRRWASACNSSSSRCFALSSPDLCLLALNFRSLQVLEETCQGSWELTLVPALPDCGLTAMGQTSH
jgi:hypothetical protein